MSKPYLTKEQALQKLQRYCAYQDRCHAEVRTKLIELGVYGDTLEEIIVDLIIEKFLDEERYAKSYARGKFRLKKWGRVKIRQELKFRKISAYCIKKGMAEIDEEEYYNTLTKILIVKFTQYMRKYDEFASKQKAAKYAQQRGYELGLIWEILKSDLDLSQAPPLKGGA